ncbi:MAG: glucuronosyltransferase [Planctomycetes bacterium]|jgi:UDP-N-acetylglucosamine transferase subunit ALG13|nr:glucuronosyltransferase [Planctomycetota bacterium]
MIFLTVGTQFPFDRLVKTIDQLFDEGVMDDEVFGQIGDTTYRPRNFAAVASLEKQAFDERFRAARAIISHAGMGAITMALDHGKPLLVLPRQRRHREVVNNHQRELAERFAALGHILVARDETQLRAKVGQLGSFVPRPREAQPELVARKIRQFLETLRDARGAS